LPIPQFEKSPLRSVARRFYVLALPSRVPTLGSTGARPGEMALATAAKTSFNKRGVADIMAIT
jgi:hypothetical protein